MNIYIDIDQSTKYVAVYIASPDAEDDSEQHDRIFSWESEDEFGAALADAESYANRLSWKLGHEIIKNYGDVT